MTTRRQKGDRKQFRPDAFASSVEFDRGLLGNQVAERCSVLSDTEEIAMLWWLQQVSWRQGGIDQFACEFLEANQSRIGTPSMLKFGMAKGQVYTAEQVRAVRDELECEEDFPLRGESVTALGANRYLPADKAVMRSNYHPESTYPDSYPVYQFTERCRCRSDGLAEHFKIVATDPGSPSLRDGLWNFPNLWDALKEWRQKEIEASRGRIVQTEITRRVAEELDFTLQSGGFVLIEGREGVGKTEAARAWCALHPGEAIYVRLESGSDEATLYRSIARVLGTACSYGRKATEMRLRIQDALQGGQLMLVLDEAHFLWPQSDRASRSAPKRVDWLRTALIDFGVPVALISTPQYFARACESFRKGGWNANQIQRRLTHTVALPSQISPDEMKAIAKWYFPHAAVSAVLRLALAASTEIGFLTVFKHLRARVDFIASRHPKMTEAECVDVALRDHPAASPRDAGAAASDSARGSGAQARRTREAPVLPTRGTAPADFPSIQREQAPLVLT